VNSIVGMAVKDTKTFFRQRGTIFWTIAFPVVIMLLFTAIFGREIPFSATIGIVDKDHTPISAGIVAGFNQTEGFFTAINFTDETHARRDLNATEIRALIIIPQGFTQNLFHGRTSLSMILDESSPDVARMVRDGVRTYFTAYYKEFYNQTVHQDYIEPITINEEAAVIGQKIGYKDNIVPGMLCYPLLFSSMVISTEAIILEREKGTLKKIRASPVRPMNVLAGKALTALFQTAISILIMATLAVVLLTPKVNWNVPLLLPVFFLGSLNGIAIGLIISCIGRAPEEASNAATTIGIVLQFFTGMYFPMEYLPTYLQQIGRVIPMTYAAQAIRDIMIRNATLGGLFQPLATLAGSAVILFAVGILLYKRWVEKE